MHGARLAVTIAVASVCSGLIAARSAAWQPIEQPQRRVLVLYAGRPELPVLMVGTHTFHRLLTERLGQLLDYNSEYMDVVRIADGRYRSALSAFVLEKYRGRPFDVVIAHGVAALDFLAQYRDELFPDTPVVFDSPTAMALTDATGVTYTLEMRRSLELALRLQPDTRRVFVVGGASDDDRWYEDAFRRDVGSSYTGPPLTYLVSLPLAELTRTLRTLPPRSIVLFLSFAEDGLGTRFNSDDVLEKLAAASNAPLYGWLGEHLGRGVVGGRMARLGTLAEHTAALAVRVLKGERAAAIPVAAVDIGEDQVDWRQLVRWNIDDARIPTQALVMFRQRSRFADYKWYVVGVIGIMLLQTVLIASLLIQRRRRRRAEESLQESEARFRAMADTAPVMLWRAGPDTLCDFFNRSWLEFRGRRLEDEIGNGWTTGVHPDDRDGCLATYRKAFEQGEAFRMEFRLKRADGQYRWVLDTGVPRPSSTSGGYAFIGSCLDITERKLAEDTLRRNEAALRRSNDRIQDLAGRLITVQEAERAHLARDLHDDIGQEVAGLSIALSSLKRRRDVRDNAELSSALASLQKRTSTLADGVRHLSHDLHPSVLDHAGLAEALKAHCDEFAQQYNIPVTVEADADVESVDPASALCLYRVAQEALHNVAKHAHAHSVYVALRRAGGTLALSIVDDGIGFDYREVQRRSTGLGLRSIDERVRLARGRITVDSVRGIGTTLLVHLPTESRLPVSHDATRH